MYDSGSVAHTSKHSNGYPFLPSFHGETFHFFEVGMLLLYLRFYLRLCVSLYEGFLPALVGQ